MKTTYLLFIYILFNSLEAAAQSGSTWSERLWLKRPERRSQIWAGGGPFFETFTDGNYSRNPYIASLAFKKNNESYASPSVIGTPYGLSAQISRLTRCNRWFAIMLTEELSQTIQTNKWYVYDNNPWGYSITQYNPATGTFEYSLKSTNYTTKMVTSTEAWATTCGTLILQLPGGRAGIRTGVGVVVPIHFLSNYPSRRHDFRGMSTLSAYYAINPRLRIDVQKFFIEDDLLSPQYNLAGSVLYSKYIFGLQYQLTKPKN